VRVRTLLLAMSAAALVVVVVIVGAAALAPARALNMVAALAGGYEVRTDIAYGALPRQQLDIYTPRTPAPEGGWPMVVFFYGGSWNKGARADYAFVGAALASHGVLTLVADYRLYPEVRYPDFLADSAQALAYGLKEAADLRADPHRIFVMGHSAGAYNAAMLALDPRWLAPTGHAPGELAGWIGLAGPYDFLPSTNPDVQPVFFHPNYPSAAQPIEHTTDARRLRALLGAPVKDEVVNPLRSTQGLATRLRAAGAPITLKLYQRPSHATLIGAMSAPLRWIAPVHDDVLAFIGAVPTAAVR